MSIKGQAFRALAAIAGGVDHCDRDIGGEIVELLDASHVLPPAVDVLKAQHVGLARGVTPTRVGAFGSSYPGAATPPLIGTGIAHELDHVENESQAYSTTTAFVALLRALFACGPQHKPGKGWLRLQVDPHFTYVCVVSHTVFGAWRGLGAVLATACDLCTAAGLLGAGSLWRTCSCGLLLGRTVSEANAGGSSPRVCHCSTTSLRRTRCSIPPQLHPWKALSGTPW